MDIDNLRTRIGIFLPGGLSKRGSRGEESGEGCLVRSWCFDYLLVDSMGRVSGIQRHPVRNTGSYRKCSGHLACRIPEDQEKSQEIERRIGRRDTDQYLGEENEEDGEKLSTDFSTDNAESPPSVK